MEILDAHHCGGGDSLEPGVDEGEDQINDLLITQLRFRGIVRSQQGIKHVKLGAWRSSSLLHEFFQHAHDASPCLQKPFVNKE